MRVFNRLLMVPDMKCVILIAIAVKLPQPRFFQVVPHHLRLISGVTT